MELILLYGSTGLVILGFILYLILIFLGRNTVVSKNECYGIVKDTISEYDSINVIETKGYFTLYNIKRKVIKLTSSCYYGNDLSSVVISLIEAGISIVDNKKNKYIEMFRNVFTNLKILYIFALIAIVINHSSFNISDAKVSSIFMIFFIIISHILLNIKIEGSYLVSQKIDKVENINKDNKKKIISFMDKMLWCDKLIYLGEIMMIIRFVLIILEII